MIWLSFWSSCYRETDSTTNFSIQKFWKWSIIYDFCHRRTFTWEFHNKSIPIGSWPCITLLRIGKEQSLKSGKRTVRRNVDCLEANNLLHSRGSTVARSFERYLPMIHGWKWVVIWFFVTEKVPGVIGDLISLKYRRLCFFKNAKW